MKSILETVFFNVVGTIMSIIVILFLVLVAFRIIKCIKLKRPKQKSVLYIDFSGDIVDLQLSRTTIFKQGKEIILHSLIDSIDYAAKDPKIKAIRIDLDSFNCGWAKLEEIRKALKKFKNSKKKIIIHAKWFSNKSWYIATLADKIIFSPEGAFIWIGLGARYFYYKHALERLKISPIEFHVGEYKSYGETFYKSKMSKYSTHQIQELLDTLYAELLDSTSKDRNINKKELKGYATNLKIQTSNDALKYKLVDKLGYDSDVKDYLKKLLKIKKQDKVSYIKFTDYYKYKKGKERVKKNKIAVIFAEGQIIPGKSKYGKNIGSDDIIKTIRAVKEAKDIKAVVIRINSPGGSVLASDEIWHELKLLNDKKPLIASMSDVAASGGYYIACASRHIFANKNTITGSIGVLALMFKTERLFKEYLGVTNSTVTTEPHADLIEGVERGLQRSLTHKEKASMQKIIEEHYSKFIHKVSKARKISLEAVDKVARGRVWIGSAAKKNQLIDKIGTLQDAIKFAYKVSGIKDDYSVNYWPRPKRLIEMIFDNPYSHIKQRILKDTLGKNYIFFEKLNNISNLEGIQAIMSADIDIF